MLHGFAAPHKDSSDFLAGVSQLLGPKTVLTANLSLGVESGDLNDPYRGVFFGDLQPNPQPGDLPSLFPEVRPRHRLLTIGLYLADSICDAVERERRDFIPLLS